MIEKAAKLRKYAIISSDNEFQRSAASLRKLPSHPEVNIFLNPMYNAIR